jgi:acetyl-CoA carboxylase biotin carboxylase subunit
MISKLIVWGSNRYEAIQVMKRALHEYKITGIKTSIPFLGRIMETTDFILGQYDTGFIENNKDTLFNPKVCNLSCQDVALMVAFVDYLKRREKQLPLPVTAVKESAWKTAGRRT